MFMDYCMDRTFGFFQICWILLWHPQRQNEGWRGWRESVMISESHPLCPTLWAGGREVDSSQKNRERAELAEKSKNHVRSWCEGFLIKSDFWIAQVCFQCWEQRRETAQPNWEGPWEGWAFKTRTRSLSILLWWERSCRILGDTNWLKMSPLNFLTTGTHTHVPGI